MTAVINAVLETEIFCHRYLIINNSAIKQCFLLNFGSSFTDTFRNNCASFYHDTFRFGISIAHCLGVYFFSWTQCRLLLNPCLSVDSRVGVEFVLIWFLALMVIGTVPWSKDWFWIPNAFLTIESTNMQCAIVQVFCDFFVWFCFYNGIVCHVSIALIWKCQVWEYRVYRGHNTHLYKCVLHTRTLVKCILFFHLLYKHYVWPWHIIILSTVYSGKSNEDSVRIKPNVY